MNDDEPEEKPVLIDAGVVMRMMTFEERALVTRTHVEIVLRAICRAE